MKSHGNATTTDILDQLTPGTMRRRLPLALVISICTGLAALMFSNVTLASQDYRATLVIAFVLALLSFLTGIEAMRHGRWSTKIVPTMLFVPVAYFACDNMDRRLLHL